MKTTNPWVIIRWSSVVILYVATLLIAIDQVGMARQEMIRFKIESSRALSKANEAKNEAQQNIRSQAYKAKLNEDTYKNKITLLEDSVKLLDELVKTSNSEKRLQAQANIDMVMGKTSPMVARQVSVPSSPALQKPVILEQPLVWWSPPLRASVAKNIKEAAFAKWKDNYQMVDYEIENQTEAYDTLLSYNKNYRPEVKNIIARAINKWKSNYAMVVYEIESQIEAKERITNR